SRRRHTRSKRDWSSDVCSSDLDDAVVEGLLQRRVDCGAHRLALEAASGIAEFQVVGESAARARAGVDAAPGENQDGALVVGGGRSEERRVGEEGWAGGVRCGRL